MSANHVFVAPQQLEKIYRELGSDLCRTLGWLTEKLSFEFTLPWGRIGGSPREYAELREARTLVSIFKYPDPAGAVRRADMAWALALVWAAYRKGGNAEGAALFEKAAAMLDVDLAQEHAIPQDLDHKISNELQLGRRAVSLPLAAAA